MISDGYELERIESLLPVVSIEEAEEWFFIADDVVVYKMIVEPVLFDGVTSDYCFVAEIFKARQQAFIGMFLDYSIPFPVLLELLDVFE